MTKVTAQGCCWVDSDADDGLHHVCGDYAVFLVNVEWDVEAGTARGEVPLCMRHSLIATKEGIAKR